MKCVAYQLLGILHLTGKRKILGCKLVLLQSHHILNSATNTPISYIQNSISLVDEYCPVYESLEPYFVKIQHCVSYYQILILAFNHFNSAMLT